MREIKYRAFDGHRVRYDVTGFEHGDKNEMALIFLDGDIYHIRETPKIFGRMSEEACVMQYTGLKDKNGKEIYEGDILSFRIFKGFVTFELGSYLFNLDTMVGTLDEYLKGDKMEVIGNIHENKELLS